MNGRGRLGVWLMAAAVVALVGAGVLNAGRGASAQNATPVPSGSGPSTVSVSGHGSVMVTPDAASISVGVTVINANLSEAQAQATSTMNAVLDALRAAGISDNDVQTSNYSVNVLQEYDTNGLPARVSGYQVSNQVNVMIRDLGKLGDILDAAVQAGANSIYGVSFIVTDSTKAATQARKDAVADATRKAQEIADATGMRLGRVVSVNETSSPVPMPAMYGAADMAVARAVPIQPGTNEVAVDLQMTFELVP